MQSKGDRIGNIENESLQRISQFTIPSVRITIRRRVLYSTIRESRSIYQGIVTRDGTLRLFTATP